MRGGTVHNCALVAAGKRHLSQPPKVSGTVPAGLTSKPQRPVASIMLQHPRGKLQSTPRKSLPERCASPRWSTESTAEGVLHRTSRTQSWTTATFGLKGGAHSHVRWQSSPNMGLCHLSVLPLKSRRRGHVFLLTGCFLPRNVHAFFHILAPTITHLRLQQQRSMQAPSTKFEFWLKI